MSHPIISKLSGCLLACLIFMGGCSREQTPVVTPQAGTEAASPGQGPSSPATPEAGPKTFAVPFRGVIRAKEKRDILVNTWNITYTIGDRKIRREAVRQAPLGKLLDPDAEVFGIICDLPANQVTLYRARGDKKHFVRMTVAELEALIQGGSGIQDLESPEPMRSRYMKASEYVGTFFVDFPVHIATTSNQADARRIQDLSCDLYTAAIASEKIEAWHCPQIKVERELIRLVDWQLPPEVSGFPLLMQRLRVQPGLEAIANSGAGDKNASRGRQVLQSGAKWLSKATEQMTQRALELLEIIGQAPPDTAFSIDPDYTESPSFDEMDKLFTPPPSPSDHDFDFDD